MSRIYDVVERLSGFSSIWFDLDGTLYETDQFYLGAFEDMASRLGEYGLEEEARVFVDYAMGLQRGKGCDYPRLIDDILGDLGLPAGIKPDLLKTYRAHDCRYLELDDRVEGALAALGSRHIPMGVVTNGGQDLQMRKIRKLGIEGYLERIVILDPQKKMVLKPAAHSFLDELGGRITAGAVMVGDRFDIDGRFAASLGMTFICVGFHGN